MPDDLRAHLKTLLDRERALYGDIEAKVAQEESCVYNEDWEGLLRTLQEKQTLISQQEALQESWKSCAVLLDVEGGRESPVFWDTLAQRLDRTSYQELSALVDGLREVARRTLERERAVQENLEVHLDALRARMRQVQKGKAAFRTYVRAGGSTSAP